MKNSGWWIQKGARLNHGQAAVNAALSEVAQPMFIVNSQKGMAVSHGGAMAWDEQPTAVDDVYPLIAHIPPLHPEKLGSHDFKQRYGLRYAYVVGAMANGITSVEMVETAAKAGMLGFFGAAGLDPDDVDGAILTLRDRLGDKSFGLNLIHTPSHPELEEAVVRLYLQRGVHLVSASAYLDLTLPLVYFRVKGIHRDDSGQIICPNKIVAKVSRVEVARKFLAPPPEKRLQALVQAGLITQAEAKLAESIPMADDLTAEADSGGHTDNRPAITLLPTMIALRDELSSCYGYAQTPCVGLGGGIATPHAVAAAFAMGAAYVLAGSVHQGCVEAGTSTTVRQMLAETRQADVIMAPSADMFEMGVKVQVLKRGTLFPLRAAKLYELYRNFDSLDDIPSPQRGILERDFFRGSISGEWEQTKAFFARKDPKQIERAEQDPKHKMALVFRAYLGKSSLWAKTGEPGRKIDYQIWCGPTMGAFNQWCRGSFLEALESRTTETVALNFLLGAAKLTRINWLECQGITLSNGWRKLQPLELSKIKQTLEY
jgi:trans-AT polyketide synthase, acyltransferase and oxidoreductase domains